jgi:hypothetical protein
MAESETPHTEPPVPETPRTTTTTPKEIGINKPTPFDGNRKKVESFLQKCKVYLQINKAIYTTDETKIAFILSFVNEKEALKWKIIFL